MSRRLLRLTVIALAASALAGCSARKAASDRGGPVWPDLRMDRGGRHREAGPEAGRDLAAADLPDAGLDIGGDSALPAESGPDLPPSGWSRVPVPTSEDLHEVACLQGEVFAVGNKGVILHRAAGGPGFVLQKLPQTTTQPPTPDLHTVSFASPTLGVTAGEDPQIWTTADLGATWTVAPQCGALVFDTVYALHFSSSTEGFGAGVVTGGAGGAYKTFGGYSWVCGPQAYAGEEFYDVFRLSTQGWIVGSTGGKIYRTEDAGASWGTVSAGTSQALRAVHFSGPLPLVGVAVGNKGAIVRSGDGQGKVWGPVSALTQDALWDVYLWDDQKGWIVGDSGTILHSQDGGMSWDLQPVATSVRLEGVCFSSATEGWAVGAGGAVFHTSTGGI